jgi:hypothetical protein
VVILMPCMQTVQCSLNLNAGSLVRRAWLLAANDHPGLFLCVSSVAVLFMFQDFESHRAEAAQPVRCYWS